MHTTPSKLLLGIGVVIVLIAAGFYLFTAGRASAPTQPVASTTPESDKLAARNITWKIIETEDDAQGTPHAEVSVTVDGKTTVVGTFAGVCKDIAASGGIDGKGLVAGELSAVQCYWAGSGDEIGVFAHEDGGYDIMVGELGEPTAEDPAFRGNFKIRASF
jgi:hypothetical protein